VAAAAGRAYRAGRRAESVAALLLRLKGYRILARRFKTPAGEIDILARRGSLLVAVEVKRRAGRGGIAQDSPVPPRQWARLARAVQWWLAGRRAPHAVQLRFDLIFIADRRWPVHVRDAWRPGDAGGQGGRRDAAFFHG